MDPSESQGGQKKEEPMVYMYEASGDEDSSENELDAKYRKNLS